MSLSTAATKSAPSVTTFYTIDATTVPYWLAVSVGSGSVVSPIKAGNVAGTPSTFTLGPSAAVPSLSGGSYSAMVAVNVVGSASLIIPVTLRVQEPSSGLTVTQGTGVLTGLTWSIGAAQVPFTFNLVSSSQPIPYTVTVGTLNSTGVTSATGLSVSLASGVATSLGSQVSVTLSPLAYGEATAGDALSDTITVHYGTSSTIVIPFTLAIGPPVAAITSLTPGSVPIDTNTSDTVNLVITGSGFVPSGVNEVTAVFAGGIQLVSGVTVVNSSTIFVAIPVTVTNFDAAGTMSIAVLNPNGASSGLVAPVTPPAALDLKVVGVPIISAITSASSFIQNGANATFAPYDFVTIFGTNLCPDCSGGSANLIGSPDTTFFRYPTALSPDSGTHFLQVQFNKHSDLSFVAPGYLIFASNTQINLLVPASLATVSSGALLGMGTVDVVVSYGTTAPPAAPMNTETSDPYTVGMATANPGIFAASSDGTGQGAILNSDFSTNSQANPIARESGTAIIYMTGLGAPTSNASNASTATSLAYPGSCISALGAGAPIGYMGTVNAEDTPPSPLWTSVDGAIIQSALIVGNGVSHFAPCNSPVTATVAGLNATVTYAGWVADSVAGLYQVNVTIPSGAAKGTAVSVPVVVTALGKSSQPGVTLWAK